jgi:putative endonuclease
VNALAGVAYGAAAEPDHREGAQPSARRRVRTPRSPARAEQSFTFPSRFGLTSSSNADPRATTVAAVPEASNQALARLGEQFALEHYERLGFALLARNHRTGAGEIDLIVHDRRAIVFVEVTTRRVRGLDPLLAVPALKRRRIRVLAAAWLTEHPDRPHTRSLRSDAVAVVVDERDRLVALEQVEDVA